MEGKVLLPSEIMAFLDCAKDPIDLYEDALVVFRINLEYANDDFLAGIIVIEYAFKLQSYSHIQEAYNYLQDCEIESAKHSSINSVSIIGVIKNVRLNLLILEHKWSRAEKEAFDLLDWIERTPGPFETLEYEVRKNLSFILRKRKKYRDAQEQRRIANSMWK